MMEDIEQDGHVRGHFLFYHKHEDKNQEDGAEEEDQGEVGATCAQGLGHSSLCLESQHSPQYEGVGEEDEDEVQSQQSPSTSKLVETIDDNITTGEPGDRHIGTEAVLNDIFPTIMETSRKNGDGYCQEDASGQNKNGCFDYKLDSNDGQI